MGWASFNEDIISRLYRNLRSRAEQTTKGSNGESEMSMESDPASFAAHRSVSRESEVENMEEFGVRGARPLPVILLADVSGSMSVDGKGTAMNSAVAEMLSCFSGEDDTRAEIHAAVITFGGECAQVHLPLGPAAEHTWSQISPTGRTPMGDAFRVARELIEDRELVPARAYRPAIILVSDGIPTDTWEGPLQSLLSSERASKSQRFAMAIGDDANREVLQAFLGEQESQLFEAHEVREINRFFQWVTMSVTSRSRSMNPNDPDAGSIDLADIPY